MQWHTLPQQFCQQMCGQTRGQIYSSLYTEWPLFGKDPKQRDTPEGKENDTAIKTNTAMECEFGMRKEQLAQVCYCITKVV